MQMLAWLHDLSPFIIKHDILPTGGLRWYGLSYLAGFMLAALLLRMVFARGLVPVSIEGKKLFRGADASDLVMSLAIFGVIGGRFGWCLFYHPEALVTFDKKFPYWEALMIHHGGMSSHGGMIGVMTGGLYHAYRRKVNVLYLWDCMAFAAPTGLMFGRVANFINGELWGRKTTEDVPFSMQFPASFGEDPEAVGRFAAYHGNNVETVEMMLDAHANNTPGYALELYNNYAVGASQAALKWYEAPNAELREILENCLSYRYPSPIIAALTEGVFVGIVVWVLWYKPKSPGIIAGAFCLCYAIARIINENFREPDADLWLGITRGQFLSIGLAIAALVILTFAIMKHALPLGGWGKNHNLSLDNQKETT